MRKRKLKVYGVNLDGRHRGIVAAHNQREAAEALGCSLSNVRIHGCETGNAQEIEVAMSDPGVGFKCKYSDCWAGGTWTKIDKGDS